MAADGLITIRSAFGPEETMNRLEAEVKAKGMTVFAHVDHAAGAAAAGMSLRPTDLLVFGAAKGGTPLMELAQTIGIDLPLKALIWQDAAGATWLSYNDPSWLAERHAVNPKPSAALNALSAALKAVTAAATTAKLAARRVSRRENDSEGAPHDASVDPQRCARDRRRRLGPRGGPEVPGKSDKIATGLGLELSDRLLDAVRRAARHGDAGSFTSETRCYGGADARGAACHKRPFAFEFEVHAGSLSEIMAVAWPPLASALAALARAFYPHAAPAHPEKASTKSRAFPAATSETLGGQERLTGPLETEPTVTRQGPNAHFQAGPLLRVRAGSAFVRQAMQKIV
jgi:uncharacterized protein (DUF302 family)